MKKLVLGLVFAVGLAGASVSAWEPNDFTKYPPVMEAGDWIFNLGVGFGFYDFDRFGSNYIFIPRFRGTFDLNTPIGESKLPFFAGLLLGYSGHGYKGDGPHWFYHNITVGGRFGYHFNWDVEKLDTYAVTTVGWVIYAGDVDRATKLSKIGDPIVGVNVGIRYFVTDWFGFWTEGGLNTSLHFFDVGFAFKF
ncbi:MAG: hypothetical protein LBI06_04565 [Treponema sp.]|jgi:hypothetical protein|nr:hypothetical protein [Treponema sp.]